MECLSEYVKTALCAPHTRLPSADRLPSAPLEPVTDELISDLRDALAHIDSDPYVTWINTGQALFSLGARGKDLWLEWSSKSTKFDQRLAEAKWSTFSADRTGYRAVFAEARRQGWGTAPGGYWSNVPVHSSVREFSRQFKEGLQPKVAGWAIAAPISEEEWSSARIAPDTIVEGYLYADVGVFVAPGGTGKTTWVLYVLASIVLGQDICGMAVRRTGPVVLLTAEDSREMLVARLRLICAEMQLSDEERRLVMANLRILDASGSGLRLTEVDRDIVRPASEAVDALIDGCRELRPCLIVIDPAVSFGVGESRVNDAEQGLVEVGRRLRTELNCGILFVHHTGKANGRDKALDQYAGRGGSAFADGSRMVHVLQPLSSSEWFTTTGSTLEPNEHGLILARPKMSYTAPQLPLYIKRRGYRFIHIEPASNRGETKLESDAQKIWQFLKLELTRGHKHSRNSLSCAHVGLKRADLRVAVARLEASGRIETRSSGEGGRGGMRHYLHPIDPPQESGEATVMNPDVDLLPFPPFASPPPLRVATPAKQSREIATADLIDRPAMSGEATPNQNSNTSGEGGDGPVLL